MEKQFEVLKRVLSDEPIVYMGELYYPYCIYATCFIASPNGTDLGSGDTEISFGEEFECDGNYFFNGDLFNKFNECVGGSFTAEGLIGEDYSIIYLFEDGTEAVFLYCSETEYLHDVNILEKVYKINTNN